MGGKNSPENTTSWMKQRKFHQCQKQRIWLDYLLKGWHFPSYGCGSKKGTPKTLLVKGKINQNLWSPLGFSFWPMAICPTSGKGNCIPFLSLAILDGHICHHLPTALGEPRIRYWNWRPPSSSLFGGPRFVDLRLVSLEDVELGNSESHSWTGPRAPKMSVSDQKPLGVQTQCVSRDAFSPRDIFTCWKKFLGLRCRLWNDQVKEIRLRYPTARPKLRGSCHPKVPTSDFDPFPSWFKKHHEQTLWLVHFSQKWKELQNDPTQ